jgi:hypothetical protein
MKERGLLLNTDLRPKARCGDKTNTRRLPKFQPLTPNSVLCTLIDSTSREDSKFKGYNYFCEIKNGREVKGTRTGYFKPQYQVGDHLYLQEPYQIEACNIFRVCCVNYSDDNKGKKRTLTSRELKLWNNRKKPYMKTSSRFMYKSLARTWFEVTEVRAERLQDISETDAKAEGIESHWDGSQLWYKNYLAHCDLSGYDGAIKSFETLWDSCSPDGFKWKDNPFVFAYTFKKIEKVKL